MDFLLVNVCLFLVKRLGIEILPPSGEGQEEPLFCSSAQCLVEVDDGLHLVEVVGHFRELCVE